MPTYEFHCPAGHEFEKFYRKISGAPFEAACPTCGKIAERKISAGAGLVFKGTGFYITDYGKDGKKDQHPRHHNGHVEATIPALSASDNGNGHSGNGASGAHESASSESKPSEPKAAASKSSEPKSTPSSE